MKIALVVHDFLRGVGHGRYCIELAQRYSSDHEVCVFANRFEANLDLKIQTRRVPALRMSAVTSVLSFIGQAERMLQKEKFDIIHAQGLSCRRADVITAHVCNVARYRIAPAKTFKERIFPALVIPRERGLYESANASEIIAVSNVVKRELEAEYRCQRVSVIYHGVNASEFAPATPDEKLALRKEFRLPANKLVWLFGGEAAKGLKESIRALAEFPDAHLMVVSRSPLSCYETEAKRSGVFERISFVGATDQMEAVYRAADLFVYPSRYDTFGMVVAEAMACGLPVVVGNNIGAAEWIRDGENGFLCDPNDLASALRKARSQNVSERARMTALAHSWDECATETMEIYERAISNSRKRR
jgi:UDP-glucose:(heptosyl)LPS alpha-1,3-glucosyltransferase